MAKKWSKKFVQTNIKAWNIFKGLFKNVAFRALALVTKKLWAILNFFNTDRTFYRPVPNPMHQNDWQKNPLD